MSGITALQALVLCRDPQLEAQLRTLLDAIGIDTEVLADPAQALEKVKRWKYDAVVVDCAPIKEASDLLRNLRALPSSRNAVIFAIISETAEAGAAFRLGATFVLERPLSAERTRRTLQAGYGLMLRERQRYFRQPLQTMARVTLGGGAEVGATTINLSETGAAILLPFQAAAPRQRVTLRFALPNSPHEIKVLGQIIWADGSGRIGVQFRKIDPDGLRRLQEWLVEQLHQRVRKLLQGGVDLTLPEVAAG